MQYSQKGLELISMYKEMSEKGYKLKSGGTIESGAVYSDFELSKVKDKVRDIFTRYNIKTVLDYGSGGSNWLKLALFSHFFAFVAHFLVFLTHLGFFHRFVFIFFDVSSILRSWLI